MPHPTDSRSDERMGVEYGSVGAQAVGRCTKSAVELASVSPTPSRRHLRFDPLVLSERPDAE
jgi:hypothetical protein